MLQSARELRGFALHALDGDIGHVSDIYFEDDYWVCRYLVVETGNWLAGRTVLIAPPALGGLHESERRIDVALTRDQVRHSPDVNTHRPISRQWEASHFDYYGWPYYWTGAEPLGLLAVPPILPVEEGPTEPSADAPDSHLQSMRDVMGYRIAAHDGDIGHVDDFIFDDKGWPIRYLVVDTGNWWPGKKVLVSPQWIRTVQWSDACVKVDLDRRAIEEAPEYEPHVPISRDYEVALWSHYGHSGYWHRSEKCREVMTVNPICCQADDWVDLAAHLMKDVSLGALPVVRNYRDRQLLGIVTTRDIATQVVALGRTAKNVVVEEIMTRNPVICHPDDALQIAIDAMTDLHLHRIPVVDTENRLVGIISRSDIDSTVMAAIVHNHLHAR